MIESKYTPIKLYKIGFRGQPHKAFLCYFTNSFGKLDRFRGIEPLCSKNKTLQLTKMIESKYTSIILYKIGFRGQPHKAFLCYFTHSFGKLDRIRAIQLPLPIIKHSSLPKCLAPGAYPTKCFGASTLTTLVS
jgi:hypothetical protein